METTEHRCKNCTGDISDMPDSEFCCLKCANAYRRKSKKHAKQLDQVSEENKKLNEFAKKFMP